METHPQRQNGGAKPDFARHVSDALLDALSLTAEARASTDRACCRLLVLIRDAEAARNTGRDYPRTEMTRGQLKQLRFDDMLGHANGPAADHDSRAA